MATSDSIPARTSDETLNIRVDAGVPFKKAKQELVAEFERLYLRQLMKKHNGNVSKAARAAGLDRMTVHKMLNRRGVANVRGRVCGDD